MRALSLVLATLVFSIGCGEEDGGAERADANPDVADAATADSGVDAANPAGTLSEDYPGDVGLGDDPAVVWFEDFEGGSVEAIAARYDQARDNGRWSLVADTPSGTGEALALYAGAGEDAVDFYKQLPEGEEWWVRWYARYEPGVTWHHSGLWFGGYNPAMPYPSPAAGTRPEGDDRFSISVEPVFAVGGANPRFDFYNYWRGMHSWMEPPINDDGTAYYGNALVHQTGFTVDEGSWVCLEVHARLNPDPASGEGALLEVWKNDVLIASLEHGMAGYWVRDKFCPENADGPECTDFQAPADDTLDLQWRTADGLTLNAFWPQNYITDGEGTLAFDQIVVATRRIGCMR